MAVLADLHVHLLAGLDDGPQTQEEAVEMCRMMAAEEGVGHSVALAHQNEQYPLVTPSRIREAASLLSQELLRARIPLEVFPTAEVMVHPDVVHDFTEGRLLTVADRGQWLLLEMPHNLFVDLRSIVRDLRAAGVRTILAHPERTPELLHEPGAIEELINLGCLVQISTGSITAPPSAAFERALKDWITRGIVHLLGSDGHSPRRRAPRIAAAAELINRWVPGVHAEQICTSNGLAVLRGRTLMLHPPAAPRRRSWFSRLWT
ncbi:MAG: protein tyrosine phosphatase [Planctomycetes bacterium]|nr:protein tyrosine phosphatase [Planctomycetota bacterium]